LITEKRGILNGKPRRGRASRDTIPSQLASHPGPGRSESIEAR